MKSKFQREPIWWIPLARRILVWGALSSICVGGFFFLATTALALPPNLKYPLDAAQLGLTIGIPFCVAGLVIGCTAGLCAPPREPKSLFVSPFFRAVFAETILFWLFASFALGLFVGLVSCVIEPWPPWLSSENWLYVAASITFVLSLWRAINRALCAAKLK